MSIRFNRFENVKYETSKNFGTNIQNRTYNEVHITEMKRQCLKSKMEAIPPISVNTITNNVIDGQHRLKAYQELVEEGKLSPKAKLKVMYLDIPVNEETQAIIDANTHSKNWTQMDYAHSFIRAGVDGIVKLNKWCLEHPITSSKGKPKYRYGVAMIKGTTSTDSVKRGTFTCTDNELERADKIHNEIVKINTILDLKNSGNHVPYLATAWFRVRERHPFNEWVKVFKAKKQRFLKLPKENMTDWLAILSEANLAIESKNNH